MRESDGRVHYEIGRKLHRQGRLDEAIVSYRQALALSPTLFEAQNNLGAALLQGGNLDEAVEVLQRACELRPDFGQAHNNLGNVLQQQGRLDEAIAELRRAVELDPSFVDAHYNLGNAFAAQAHWEQAVENYRRALELDPYHAQSHFNLANALHQQGRLAEAVDAYRDAIAEKPDYTDALSNLGTVLKELNQAGEASDCYRQALDLRPNDRTLERNLRSALNRQLPAWHFPMLADNTRNEAYREALEKVVDASSRVLDVGTGSGLLAMIAGRAGAATVTGCEMSPAVAEAARQVIADNGYTERIAVVDKKSTALSIGEDMAQAANVLVSEIFDVGLLGEGVLPSLRHARRHLLTKDAIVIPRCACSPSSSSSLVCVPSIRSARSPDSICRRSTASGSRTIIWTYREALRESRRCVVQSFLVRALARLMLSTRGRRAGGQAVQFLEEYAAVQAGERISLDVRLSDTRIEFHRKS